MKYEYARADGLECEIDLPMAADKPEAIVLSEAGWKPAPADADPETVFRRVYSVPGTRGVVPTNTRTPYRRYRNNAGTLNLPANQCPVSLSMPPVFERGRLERVNGRDVQVYPDGTMATVERQKKDGRICGGYPILDTAKSTEKWERKLGVVNQAK